MWEALGRREGVSAVMSCGVWTGEALPLSCTLARILAVEATDSVDHRRPCLSSRVGLPARVSYRKTRCRHSAPDDLLCGRNVVHGHSCGSWGDQGIPWQRWMVIFGGQAYGRSSTRERGDWKANKRRTEGGWDGRYHYGRVLAGAGQLCDGPFTHTLRTTTPPAFAGGLETPPATEAGSNTPTTSRPHLEGPRMVSRCHGEVQIIQEA